MLQEDARPTSATNTRIRFFFILQNGELNHCKDKRRLSIISKTAHHKFKFSCSGHVWNCFSLQRFSNIYEPKEELNPYFFQPVFLVLHFICSDWWGKGFFVRCQKRRAGYFQSCLSERHEIRNQHRHQRLLLPFKNPERILRTDGGKPALRYHQRTDCHFIG